MGGMDAVLRAGVDEKGPGRAVVERVVATASRRATAPATGPPARHSLLILHYRRHKNTGKLLYTGIDEERGRATHLLSRRRNRPAHCTALAHIGIEISDGPAMPFLRKICDSLGINIENRDVKTISGKFAHRSCTDPGRAPSDKDCCHYCSASLYTLLIGKLKMYDNSIILPLLLPHPILSAIMR